MISKELRKWVDLAEEYKNEKHDTVSIAELRMWKLLLCIRSQSLSIIISCFQKLPRSHQITLEAARISSAHKRRFLFVLSSINLSRDVISTHLHPPFFLKPTRLIPIRRNVLNNEHFFFPLWGIWNSARVFCIIDSLQSRFQHQIVQSNGGVEAFPFFRFSPVASCAK